MRIKIDNQEFDIRVRLNLNDEDLDIDEVEFDGLQNNSDEIECQIISHMKISTFNKELKVESIGYFNKDEFITGLNDLQQFGSAIEPIKDDMPKIKMIIPNKFEDLNDIAYLLNFYKEENIISKLYTNWYSILSKCPKTAKVLNKYIKDTIKDGSEKYVDDLEQMIIQAEADNIIGDKIDFSWVSEKDKNIVFSELREYCDSRATYEEFSYMHFKSFIEIRLNS